MDLYGSVFVGGPEGVGGFTLLIRCSSSLHKNPWPATLRENSPDEYTYTSYHVHMSSVFFQCTLPYTLGQCLRKCLRMPTRIVKGAYAGGF